MPLSGNGAAVEVGLTKPSNSREEGRNWEGIDPLRCCQHLIHYENTQKEIPTHTGAGASLEFDEKLLNEVLFPFFGFQSS